MPSHKSLILIVGLLSLAVLTHSQQLSFVDLLVGDYNGDGRADYVRRQRYVGTTSTYANSYLATSTQGYFGDYILPNYGLNANYTNLYVGDFNGDGTDDLLAQVKGTRAEDGASNAFVILSRGTKGFSSKVVLPDNVDLNGDYTNIFVGDFNGDGDDDFLSQPKGNSARGRTNSAYLFLSKGDGTFTRTQLSDDYVPSGKLANLYLGDFNGDGNTDIVVQEKSSWSGNKEKSSWNGNNNNNNNNNDDTNTDDDTNTAYLLLSKGKGSFQKVALSDSYALQGNSVNLYIGDFNGDGQDDILRQEKGNSNKDSSTTAQVLLSTTKSGKFTVVTLSESYGLDGDLTNIYIGDFNGDGQSDFIAQNKGGRRRGNSQSSSVFISTGKGKFTQTALPDSWDIKGDEHTLFIGDFDNDGRDDFISQFHGSFAKLGSSSSIDYFYASSKSKAVFTQV